MRELAQNRDLFNRSLIMRSQRELATLNYFDAEKLISMLVLTRKMEL